MGVWLSDTALAWHTKAQDLILVYKIINTKVPKKVQVPPQETLGTRGPVPQQPLTQQSLPGRQKGDML